MGYQSMAAKRNPGLTDLFSSKQKSVSTNAWYTILYSKLAGSLKGAFNTGNSGVINPSSFNTSKFATALPAKKSFKNSSKRRAAGMSSSKYAKRGIGSRHESSMRKPSFVAKRTARNIRTGSSR